MAKKPQKLAPLTFEEIVLRGDSETIRQALEARTKIDTLLEEREAAYQRISELESQVESIVGEEGVFPFPAPPAPVSAFPAPAPAKKAAKKAAPKPAKEEEPKTEEAPESEKPAEEEE
ncbi:hypothetical protein IEN85_05560 [Pelagicoccus sp. NFK12]|uniref:Uncharacterized protein n=1 Tax=Pelagicoccus enzymogenes TaxID=2773457 RepID=A0A927IGA3_9BACT|nr:hypothetical protein [Pelagicoccus enzymogenes]MBD5778951.1 hypothetical protein [Pelagicoccus enzymogenes]MDQ8197305.1 hypothetical protein [Pelagicoccus enzymogenes]